MERGEIWWADLPAPIGRRPVLLLSRNAAYKVRTSITVAIITRTIREIPVEVMLDKSDGMPSRCVVNLDDILTIPIVTLKDRLATLWPERMAELEKAIKFALDIRT